MGFAEPPTNKTRAEWASVGLEAFHSAVGDSLTELEADPESVMSDLICDLMHFAVERGLDFEHALESARMNYEAEEEELA